MLISQTVKPFWHLVRNISFRISWGYSYPSKNYISEPWTFSKNWTVAVIKALNYGHDVDTLKFFTLCGLQEGYEPFCVNMTRPLTHWYTKHLPIFENTEDLSNTKIDVTRLPAGSDNPPSLKVSHNTYEQEERADWEFMRLSLPVTCNDRFIR